MEDTLAGAEPAATPAGTPPAARARPWRRRAVLAARIVAALALVYFVALTTVHQWREVRDTFHRLSWPVVLLSLLAAVLAIATTALAWRSAIDDLDHTVPVAAAGQVFLVGQLGKYLPGSVWSYVLQMELGRRAGIPRARAFLASLITTGLGITVGLAFGALGLPATLHAAAHGSGHAGTAQVAFWSALVLLPVGLVCAHPAVLTRLVGTLLRILRREPLDRPLSWRGVLATCGWAAAGYLLFAVHLWLLVRTQGGAGVSGLVACLGAISLAIAVSTVVVIAPSGIGVREFMIAVTLGGVGMSFGTGYAIALASRLVITVADVLAAGLAAALAVRQVRRQSP